MISFLRNAVLFFCAFLLLSVRAFAFESSITENWKTKAYKVTDTGLEIGVLPLTGALLPPPSPTQPLPAASEMEQLRSSLTDYLVLYVYASNHSGNIKAYLYPAFNAVYVSDTGKQRLTSIWDSASPKRTRLQALAEVYTRNPASDDSDTLQVLLDGLDGGYSYRLKEKYPLLSDIFESMNGVLFPGAVKDGLIFFPKPDRGCKELRLYLPNIRLQESGFPTYRLYDFVFSLTNPGYDQTAKG